MDIKYVDLYNNYNPNLNDILESAQRTFGEASAFFDMANYSLTTLLIELREKTAMSKDIYDKVNAIATIFAVSCENFLKALFLYEHINAGLNIEELWEQLGKPDFKVDVNGNYVYEKEISGKKVFVYAVVDGNGNRVVDANGKNVYKDSDGNVYSEGSQGKKVKTTGHDIDRLIHMLSTDSKFMLESRMLSIKMNDTEKQKRVSLVDVLESMNIVSRNNQISRNNYDGWVEQHKRTFIEARYGGEKRPNINMEFLYHLATQIRAVVQYKIEPEQNQKFNLSSSELSRQPTEIQNLAEENPDLLTGGLIKLLALDDSIRRKFELLFKPKFRMPLKSLNPSHFFHMLCECSEEEIRDISMVGYLRTPQGKRKLKKVCDENPSSSVVELKGYIEMLNKRNIDMNLYINYYIQLKRLNNNGAVKISDVAGDDFCLDVDVLTEFMNLVNKSPSKYEDSDAFDIEIEGWIPSKKRS